MNVLFVVFCLLVLRPNSMGKLVNSRCKLTCKRLLNYMAAYVYANEQWGSCFYVSVRYSLLFISEIILKQLYASGLRRIIVKYI